MKNVKKAIFLAALVFSNNIIFAVDNTSAPASAMDFGNGVKDNSFNFISYIKSTCKDSSEGTLACITNIPLFTPLLVGLFYAYYKFGNSSKKAEAIRNFFESITRDHNAPSTNRKLLTNKELLEALNNLSRNEIVRSLREKIIAGSSDTFADKLLITMWEKAPADIISADAKRLLSRALKSSNPVESVEVIIDLNKQVSLGDLDNALSFTKDGEIALSFSSKNEFDNFIKKGTESSKIIRKLEPLKDDVGIGGHGFNIIVKSQSDRIISTDGSNRPKLEVTIAEKLSPGQASALRTKFAENGVKGKKYVEIYKDQNSEAGRYYELKGNKLISLQGKDASDAVSAPKINYTKDTFPKMLQDTQAEAPPDLSNVPDAREGEGGHGVSHGETATNGRLNGSTRDGNRGRDEHEDGFDKVIE